MRNSIRYSIHLIIYCPYNSKSVEIFRFQMNTERLHWKAGSIPKFSGPKLNGNKSSKNTLMNLDPSRLNMNTGTLAPNSLINCLHMPHGLIGSSESPLIAINLSVLWPSVCQIVSSFHMHFEYFSRVLVSYIPLLLLSLLFLHKSQLHKTHFQH